MLVGSNQVKISVGRGASNSKPTTVERHVPGIPNPASGSRETLRRPAVLTELVGV